MEPILTWKNIVNDRQRRILECEELRNNYCMFCGKELSDDTHNSAEDNSLHYMSTEGYCCDSCNKIVVKTNRCLSNAIIADRANMALHITEAINNLMDVLEKVRRDV